MGRLLQVDSDFVVQKETLGTPPNVERSSGKSVDAKRDENALCTEFTEDLCGV
jgi:hypothetical protein